MMMKLLLLSVVVQILRIMSFLLTAMQLSIIHAIFLVEVEKAEKCCAIISLEVIIIQAAGGELTSKTKINTL